MSSNRAPSQFQDIGTLLRGLRDRSVQKGFLPPEPDPEPACPRCGGTGWLSTGLKPTSGQGRAHMYETHLELCACQTQANAQTFANFHVKGYPALVLARDAVTDWCQSIGPPILVLNAPPGRGKSHLLMAALNRIREFGNVCAYLRDGDLLDQIHASFAAKKTIQFMAELERASWVVVDDFGLSATAATMDTMLDRVIDNRSIAAELGKRTLITTNLTAEKMTPRTAARLQDVRLVRPVTIKAPDYRQNPISEE